METLQKDEKLSIKLGPKLITEASTQVQGIFKKEICRIWSYDICKSNIQKHT